MRIQAFEDEKGVEKATLLEALHILPPCVPILSVVGAGGKTTLIEQLAKEYENLGKSVGVTTTTHMWLPTEPHFLKEESKSAVFRYIKEQQVFWVGKEQEKKMTAVSTEFLEWLCEQKIPVLFEADGSKRLPCKVPAEHEPALIRRTTHVLGVIGMDALDKSIGQVCHRKVFVAQLLGKPLSHLLKEEDIAKIIGTTKGLKKDVNSAMNFTAVLHKVDNEALQKRAVNIAKELKNYGCENVIFTARKEH